MNNYTKIILICGISLTVYGYLCRLSYLYFFWESKSIGWILILIGVVSLLLRKVKKKKAEGRKSIWEKIGIGVLIFILLIQGILIVVIPRTEAYTAAKQYLLNDTKTESEIGKVLEFSLMPTGGIQISSTNGKESGSATINIIVKGEHKFKDVSISLEKNPQSNWIVVDMED